jgi:hypothetical protein
MFPAASCAAEYGDRNGVLVAGLPSLNRVVPAIVARL